MDKDIEGLLALAEEECASDLHLNVNSPPIIRVDGRLQKLGQFSSTTEEEILEVLGKITTEAQRNRFQQEHELDFSYENPEQGRFRVNALMQRGVISLAFRLLARVLSPLEALGLKDVYGELSRHPRGLILVTGPTGSGKSTTLAAMINYINEVEKRHIITIEDPIEYVHQNKNSLILQRDVGEDTQSFSIALKHALRHDPDIIVVGEMRDLTTITTAISAAETGHLVMATLHTVDATETVNRVVEVFPSGQQQQIKLQLSQVLLAVLSQTLVPRIGGGRVPACEIMLGNTAIRSIIRGGQIHQLYSSIQLGKKEGMQTLNQSLADLVIEGVVSEKEALEKSSNTAHLKTTLERLRSGKKVVDRTPPPPDQSANG